VFVRHRILRERAPLSVSERVGGVLPSIGAANPALTAMANSIRVGDRLLERLAA